MVRIPLPRPSRRCIVERSEQIGATRNAIAGLIAEDGTHPSDRGIITNFIVIAEIVGDDGEHWLRHIQGEGPMWRTLGMITAISDDIRTAMTGN